MQPPPKSRWDWLAAGLLLALVLTAAVRLAATQWTGYLYIGETMALMGTCLGLAFGVSRFRPWTVRLMAFLYTVLLVPAQLTTLSESGQPMRERLIEAWLRFGTAAITFSNGRNVDDPILFIAFISLALWLVGLVSGYGLARQRTALIAILPSAVAILIVQVYDPLPKSRLWQIALYLLFTLLLIGRLYFLESRETWQSRHIPQLPETQSDLTNGLLITAVLIIVVAWNLPLSFSSLKEAAQLWSNLTKPFEGLRKNVERAIDPLKSPYGKQQGGDFYGEDLPLGRGLPLSKSLIFRVRVPDTLENSPPRFYWRGHIYATYDGTQWLNPEASLSPYEPDQGDLPVPNMDGHEVGEFEIVNLNEQSILYAPSQPVWASVTGDMWSQPTPADAVDLVTLRASTPVPERAVYRVRSVLINPSIEELRAAGVTYPDWVTERYLQLPVNFSPRIAELAQEIGADQPTPYDKALAVTEWLRANLEYQAVIPAPPENTDALEWVLFEYKKGFCMYYATSEVLMLRSLGVPARMAVGFAQGELDEETNTYTVRQQQYHAWPEVYFPGIGWVEFEPTVSQDEIPRPLSNTVLPLPAPEPRPEVTPTPIVNKITGQVKEGIIPSPGLPWIVTNRALALTFFLALLTLMLWLLDRTTGWISRVPIALEERAERRGSQVPRWIRTWAAWTRLSPIARSFETVNLSLWLLGNPQPVSATPEERARRLSTLIPGAQERVRALTEQHELALYAGVESNVSMARRRGTIILVAAIWARLLQLGHDLEERFTRPNSFR